MPNGPIGRALRTGSALSSAASAEPEASRFSGPPPSFGCAGARARLRQRRAAARRCRLQQGTLARPPSATAWGRAPATPISGSLRGSGLTQDGALPIGPLGVSELRALQRSPELCGPERHPDRTAGQAAIAAHARFGRCAATPPSRGPPPPEARPSRARGGASGSEARQVPATSLVPASARKGGEEGGGGGRDSSDVIQSARRPASAMSTMRSGRRLGRWQSEAAHARRRLRRRRLGRRRLRPASVRTRRGRAGAKHESVAGRPQACRPQPAKVGGGGGGGGGAERAT